MHPPQDVKIAKAKGRPMLQWVGKKPLSTVPAYPAQHIERFQLETASDPVADLDWSDWPEHYPRGGLLFHGDNKDVLAHLLANGFRGKVKLIYIDPPFDSGADYVRKVKDVPERKQDLVRGRYELPAPPPEGSTVAVKIIDMLGEEILVVGAV